MHDPFDLTTIIFVLLAIFVVWKLRSVLGERNPDEPQGPPQSADMFRPAPRANGDNVVRLPGPTGENLPRPPVDQWQDFAAPGSDLWNGLSAMRQKDANFDPGAFLNGAVKAHEMILLAFASGDVKTLKMLLGTDVLANFSSAIEGRQSRGETMETTLVSEEKSSFESVQLVGNEARVTVRFRSKMITWTKNGSGEVIEGNMQQVIDVQDVWTFARDLTSRDPNWKLIAILDA